MLISSFFENQEIFLTGGSGFIGKALIEKVLRSCPKVGKIFVLLRGKKGLTPQQRLESILNTSLYNRLRAEQPQTLKRVYAIEGDCTEVGLGISAADLQRLRNVNIIFHSAASVRFDDALRDAIMINVRGTYELVKIAETLPHLKVFMHVSTAYSNPHVHQVEEKVYPAIADWRTTIKLAETYDVETLNAMNLKYSDFQPNTYTFTKSLAEQLVNEYRHKLPVIIFRPSIVICSIDEPVPGWIDNFNGPTGMLVACGIGILRTNYGDPDLVADYVPVDVVVRAMLIACYKCGTETDKKGECVVYNCTTANICPITVGEVIDIGKVEIMKNPFDNTLWAPGGGITRCYYWNLFRFLTTHILLALIVDRILWFANIKPFLLRLQRRIYNATMSLHYFLMNSWEFKNGNFYALDEFVPQEEQSEFGYLQFSSPDYKEFLRQGVRGAKEFLLKETPDSTSRARMRMNILRTVDYAVNLAFWLLLIRFTIRYVYTHYYVGMYL